MKSIKKFTEFIFEGVYINTKGEIEVSKRNDPNNPKELMKTADSRVTEYSKRHTESRDYISVYYGLYPKENALYKIPEEDWITGKIEGGKDFIRDTIKSRYMDLLKSGDFTMAPGENLGEFMNSVIKKKFPDGVDYIVKVASSKGLVSIMADELGKIYPNATIINISKNIYHHPLEIADLLAAEKAGSREMQGQIAKLPSFPESIPAQEKMDKFASRELKKRAMEIWGEKKPRGYLIKSTGASERLTKEYIGKLLSMWERKPEAEKAKGFTIDTSGKIMGSIRQFIAAKYNLGNENLRNAIYKCVVKSNDPSNEDHSDYKTTKKMVILDDNTNTGMDFIEIAKGIEKYIESDIKPLIGNDPGYSITPINKSIMGYVLYSIPERKMAEVTKKKVAKSIMPAVKSAYVKAWKKIKDEENSDNLTPKEIAIKAMNIASEEAGKEVGFKIERKEVAQIMGLKFWE